MKRILYILFLAASFCAKAQNQTIDPTVEVNRDFQGKIMEIAKGKLNTTIADSLNIYNIDFNYSFFDKQYKDLYEFSPLPSASIVENNGAHEYKFMVKGGMGTPFTPEAALWLTPLRGEKDYLSLGGDWEMYKTGLMKEQTYNGRGSYARLFNWGEGNISVSYNGGSNHNILEENTDRSYGHNFNRLSLHGSIKPFDARGTGKKHNWGVSGNYRWTQDKSTTRLNENYGIIEGYFGPTFGKYSQFTANLAVRGVEYDGHADYYYGLFEFAPNYRYEKGELTVQLSAKLSGEFTSKREAKADRYHSFIVPDINLIFTLNRDKLWAYGTLTGDNHLNAWSTLLEQNRYMNPAVNPNDIFAGSTPLDAEAGLKGRSSDKFSYSIFAKYAMHKGMVQYAYNRDGGWYNAFNSNHNEFGAGADFTSKMQNFLLGGEFLFASYSKGKNSTFANGLPACGKPKVSGNLHATYNWKGGISAGVSCKGWGSYYVAIWNTAECGKISGNADIDINLQYAFVPAFTVYVRGENILGSPSFNHPFHTGRGGCIIGGIIVKL